MRLELAANSRAAAVGVGLGLLGAGMLWQGMFGTWQQRRKEEHREERKQNVRSGVDKAKEGIAAMRNKLKNGERGEER
jgi:hypothetical protein